MSLCLQWAMLHQPHVTHQAPAAPHLSNETHHTAQQCLYQHRYATEQLISAFQTVIFQKLLHCTYQWAFNIKNLSSWLKKNKMQLVLISFKMLCRHASTERQQGVLLLSVHVGALQTCLPMKAAVETHVTNKYFCCSAQALSSAHSIKKKKIHLLRSGGVPMQRRTKEVINIWICVIFTISYPNVGDVSTPWCDPEIGIP